MGLHDIPKKFTEKFTEFRKNQKSLEKRRFKSLKKKMFLHSFFYLRKLKEKLGLFKESACHAGGRRFESVRPRHKNKEHPNGCCFVFIVRI